MVMVMVMVMMMVVVERLLVVSWLMCVFGSCNVRQWVQFEDQVVLLLLR